MKLETKRGDTEPNEATLVDATGPVSLGSGTPGVTAATVRFLAVPAVSGVGQVVDRECEVLQEADGSQRGRVRIPWEAADVAAAGTHRAEFDVLWPDGTRKTFPASGYIDWVVWSDLG